MSQIEIITFSAPYQQQVIDLIVGIQSGEFGVDITAEDQPDLKDIPNYYQTECGNFWIALDGTQVVGTISLLDIGNKQVALRKMFVADKYRGKPLNIAQNLVNSATTWSQSHSITDIFLGTVPAYHAAHRFYEKNGFKRIQPESLPANFPIMQVDKYFYWLVCKQ